MIKYSYISLGTYSTLNGTELDIICGVLLQPQQEQNLDNEMYYRSKLYPGCGRSKAGHID